MLFSSNTGKVYDSNYRSECGQAGLIAKFVEKYSIF
jgi:hypothetical protein